MNMQAKIERVSREAALGCSLQEMNEHLEKMHRRMEAYLQGGSNKAVIGDLIEMLDGPDQRRVQNRARQLLMSERVDAARILASPATEASMADDRTKVGAEDRRTVAGDEPYEVSYFATKHGITTAQAQELIGRIGNNRAELDAAAEQLKA